MAVEISPVPNASALRVMPRDELARLAYDACVDRTRLQQQVNALSGRDISSNAEIEESFKRLTAELDEARSLLADRAAEIDELKHRISSMASAESAANKAKAGPPAAAPEDQPQASQESEPPAAQDDKPQDGKPPASQESKPKEGKLPAGQGDSSQARRDGRRGR
jgi:hypothetical protein